MLTNFEYTANSLSQLAIMKSFGKGFIKTDIYIENISANLCPKVFFSDFPDYKDNSNACLSSTFANRRIKHTSPSIRHVIKFFGYLPYTQSFDILELIFLLTANSLALQAGYNKCIFLKSRLLSKGRNPIILLCFFQIL